MICGVNRASFPRFFLLNLGLLGMLGPFSIDLYLPALPEIAADFGVSNSAVQFTLSAYLVTMGIMQLVAGPISDAFGRRRPAIFGLALYTVASIFAVFAPSITALIVARIVQGIGGAVATVTTNASVRDLAVGSSAAKLFGILTTMAMVGPMIAPTIGGFVADSGGWRATFVALTVIGALILTSLILTMPDTLAVEKRTTAKVRDLLAGYGLALRNGRFMLASIALALTMGSIFTYVAGSTFVYQEVFPLSPRNFGLIFGLGGLMTIFGAQTGPRIPNGQTGYWIGLGVSFVGQVFALITMANGHGMWYLVAGLALSMYGFGIARPLLMAKAMSEASSHIGAHAAVQGIKQSLASAAVAPISGILLGFGLSAWLGLQVLLLIVAIALIVILDVGKKDVQQPQPVQ